MGRSGRDTPAHHPSSFFHHADLTEPSSGFHLCPFMRRRYSERRCIMIRPALAALLGLWVCLADDASWARRESFTPEQKDPLSKVQTILVEPTAIPDKGTAPADAI